MSEMQAIRDWAVKELYAQLRSRELLTALLARDPAYFRRVREGVSQRALARRANVHQSTVSDLERGLLDRLGADALRRLLKVYLELEDGHGSGGSCGASQAHGAPAMPR